MRKKFFILSLLGLAFAIILPFSCNNNLTNFELQNGETESNTNFTTPSMSENDIKLKAEAIRNDTLFKQLVYILIDNSFVIKSVENGSIPLSKWTELNSYVLAKNPQDTISLDDLFSFLGDQSDAFFNQTKSIQFLTKQIISMYFNELNSIEEIESTLVKACKNETNNIYSVSCCEGCKSGYEICLQHAKEDGMGIWAGAIGIGIVGTLYTLEPAPIGIGIIGGAIAGAISYGTDKKQCVDDFKECAKACNDSGCKL